MGSWNGLALQTELSKALGDTSTQFKASVLQWMNDVQDDICTRYQWPFLRVEGSKTLDQSQELQNLYISSPESAMTATLVASGNLVLSSTYAFKVTYYRLTDGYETTPSDASATQTITSGFQSIELSDIAVSTESTVTARKIYVSKDGGDYVWTKTISDNTTTTATIEDDTISTIEPPDYIGIRALVGDPYLTNPQRQLIYRTEDELRFLFPGAFPTGTPEQYACRDFNKIVVYPTPSGATTNMKFSYIKVAPRIYAEATSQPTIPIFFKVIFKKGVLSMGYEYRERGLAQITDDKYEQMIAQKISDAAKTRYGAGFVRDVVGDINGFVIR